MKLKLIRMKYLWLCVCGNELTLYNLNLFVFWFFNTLFDHFVFIINISCRNHPLNQFLDDRISSVTLQREDKRIFIFLYLSNIFNCQIVK